MHPGYSNMKKLLILLFLTALLMACAHGRTEHFPTADKSTDSSEVFIIRDNNLVGWGFSLRVVFDDNVIARLRAGEYVRFYVEPGFHSLGISKATETAAIEANQKYYFLISPDYTEFGFEINRIGDQKAEYWLARTKPLK